MKKLAWFYEWKQSINGSSDATWVIVKNLAIVVSMCCALCAAIPGHAFSKSTPGKIEHMPFDFNKAFVDCEAVGRRIGALGNQGLVSNGSDSIECIAPSLATGYIPANYSGNCGSRNADYLFVLSNKSDNVQSDNLIAMVIVGFLIGQLVLLAFITREFWGGAVLLPVAWLIQHYFKIEIWPFCSPGQLYDRRVGAPWRVSDFLRRN